MEIIATIPVYTYPLFCDILFTVAITIAMTGFAIVVFIATEEKSWTVCIIGLSLLVVGIIGIKYSLKLTNELEIFKYNEYKVIIDETVSAKDFLDKYEVISKEGEIFTIKEVE